jgi:hypothetical protein
VDFIYTTHAEESIAKRKLNKEIVEDVIKNPETTEVSRLGRRIAQRSVNNKLLRVVYVNEQSVYIVITAYYIEEGRYR